MLGIRLLSLGSRLLEHFVDTSLLECFANAFLVLAEERFAFVGFGNAA
jgi:hypothetical protein